MPASDELPEEISRRDAYARIFTWVRDHPAELRKAAGEPPDERTMALAAALPSPEVASEADLDLVFVEVLTGHLENLYVCTDQHGVPMHAYATRGLAIYEKGLQDMEPSRNLRSSALYGLSLSRDKHARYERAPDATPELGR